MRWTRFGGSLPIGAKIVVMQNGCTYVDKGTDLLQKRDCCVPATIDEKARLDRIYPQIPQVTALELIDVQLQDEPLP
jgi:hypothetical protein